MEVVAGTASSSDDDAGRRRISWKESNLAAVGSALDHKIKQAAAGNEVAWRNAIGTARPGLWVWRVEDFTLVPWPQEDYGCFCSGDSFVVLHGWVEEGTDKVQYDVYIWIGSASSQDEYGTAAYKMVEADEYLGGSAIQHREVEGKESTKFVQLFVKKGENDEDAGTVLTYWEGGVASGFKHVEPTEEKPVLFRIKGSNQKNMSLKQVAVKKSSLNSGDSFVLKASNNKVWLWKGESANQQETIRAKAVADRLCTKGSVVVLDQGRGDELASDFWAYFTDSAEDISPPEDGDDLVEEFAPLLFKLKAGTAGQGNVDDEDDLDDDFDDENGPEQVGKGESVKLGFGVSECRLDKSLLDDADVFLLDAGWEIYVWIGKDADRSEKLGAITKTDAYTRSDLRTIDLPVHFVKSGMEPADFLRYFA